jgi:hypothetical protein
MGTECSGLWRKHDLNYCFFDRSFINF